jgi:hypothetical protein
MNRLFLSGLLLTTSLPALAGDADVLDVNVSCKNDSICRFDVTVRHDDEGWEHYANRWEVLSPDGEILATRELMHPHDNEQPFTRSLESVKIPGGLLEVVVRAHDLIHGYGGKGIVVKLPD